MQVLRDLFWLSVVHNFDLTAQYIPGKPNDLADAVSRLHEPGQLFAAGQLLWVLSGPIAPPLPYELSSLPCFVFTDPRVAAAEAELDHEVVTYRAATFADSTKATYRTHLKSHLEFCLSVGYHPVPIQPMVLCRYIA